MMKNKLTTNTLNITNYGKLPPQNIELESLVLGAMLLDRSCIPTAVSILKSDSFYDNRHSLIFNAICQLFENQKPVDSATLVQALRAEGNLETVGGAFFVTSLTDRIASSANTEYHCRIIEQEAIKRRLIYLSNNILQKCYDDTADPFDILTELNEGIVQPGLIFNPSNPLPKSRMDKAQEAIKNAQCGVKSGILSGIKALDEKTGGWQKGDLTVVSGRPGMGKTAFGISIAKFAEQKVPVYWLQLEMSDEQMGLREISYETFFSVEKLKSGKLLPPEEQRVEDAVKKIRASQNHLVDTEPEVNLFKIKAKCIRAVKDYGAKLIIVDYLGLVDYDRKQGENDAKAIGNITRGLKLMAKSLDIPIILFAQLNRNVEKTAEKRPMLSDLRDSGAIEQDADNVLFLYRAEYYGINCISINGMEGPSADMVEIIVAKNRQGKLGSVFCECKVEYNRFGEVYNILPEPELSRISGNKAVYENENSPF